MCTVCGCSPSQSEEQHHHQHEHGFHEHVHADGTVERHADHHEHEHSHDHEHHHHEHEHHEHSAQVDQHGSLRLDHGLAGTEVPGMTQKRLVEIETSILGKNDSLAAKNRGAFKQLGVASFNLISSPGSGKTTLLVETLKRLQGRPMAVIEGDQQTDLDAKRIRETGVSAVQINTGKGCHLDAQMVDKAAAALELKKGELLFIENVGNLVCPAGFDLGEGKRVVLLSITEGEDKPLKYPNAFASADLVLLTKIDLQPLVQADLERLKANVRKVNTKATILEVSSRSGEGMHKWTDWLEDAGEDLRA